MAFASSVTFWEATVEVSVEDLAFAYETTDEGRGANKKRIFTANWEKDGKIWFNPSKRIGGWLKKQLPLVRSTYATQVQAIKVFPFDHDATFLPIANLSELTPGNVPLTEPHELKQHLPNPFKAHIVVGDGKGGSRVTTTYWAELKKPMTFKVKIVSFARSISPEIIKEALGRLGHISGIGDKFSQGYGRFELSSFDWKEEKLNL
jgi:hypothetical protein